MIGIFTMANVKKKRDIGRTNISVKLDDDVFKELDRLLDGKPKQRFFEQYAVRFVNEARNNPQLTLV